MFNFKQYFAVEFSSEIIDYPWKDSDAFLFIFYGPNGEILAAVEIT